MGIGDEVMAAGRAENLSRQVGKPVAILDKYGQPRAHELWRNNPFITTSHRPGGPHIVDCGGHRPYIAGGDQRQWVWDNNNPPSPATIVLSELEQQYGRRYAGKVLIEPTIKAGASPNKQWPFWPRFTELAKDYPLLMLSPGAQVPPRVRAVGVACPTIRHAAAALAHARAYVGHEGAMHHLAAAFRRPAVVIMGGFIGTKQTGYDLPNHRYLTAGGNPCGMRVRCAHCVAAMESISPEMVLQALREVLPV